MKPAPLKTDPHGVELVLPVSESQTSRARREVADVYRAHADFVYRTLQHLGVRDADLEDVLQEVFCVVHRRLHTYDERVKLTTWLFGICRNLARRHRARAYFRRERPAEAPPDRATEVTPEHRLQQAERKRLLSSALDTLSVDKRVVFVLFEIEERSCADIAELTGVPVGTVYSRLHAARKTFQAAVERLRARAGRGGEL